MGFGGQGLNRLVIGGLVDLVLKVRWEKFGWCKVITKVSNLERIGMLTWGKKVGRWLKVNILF